MPSEASYEANALTSDELAVWTENLRKGTVKNGKLIDERLRWGQSDDPETRRHWAWLVSKESKIDRDDWVLQVFQSVRDDKDRIARNVIEEKAPWDFYERHFFGWFLGRFDVRAARSIFIDPRKATRLHGLLVALLVAVPWLSLGRLDLTPSLMVFAALLALVVLIGSTGMTGLPGYAYFNSLSPRLAAAVGIGYLFFFSAPHLIKILNDTWRPWWQLWMGVVALISAAFVYLSFHISRRVHPQLNKRDLFRRSGAILSLALAYSSLGLLIAGPVLFSQTFLSTAAGGQTVTVQVDVHRLAFCAAIALNLGVILQLAWDEKPLTEPL